VDRGVASSARQDYQIAVRGTRGSTLTIKRGRRKSVKPAPRPSLDDLRRRYVDVDRSLPARIERALEADPRAGAQRILELVRRRRRERRAEGQRLRGILRFERELWQRGLTLLAGIDEAGMSPLAGPVAAAAVVLPVETRLIGVDDSKKLNPQHREELAIEIKARARAWSVAFVEPGEIDVINIYWAGILAMRRAVEGLGLVPEHLLIDARRLRDLPIPQSSIIKGDERSASIAAASILAKTARDARMIEADRLFPGYGFAQHKGYPVRAHRTALARLGPCPLHRRSFALVLSAQTRQNRSSKAKSR
jgi:ribonuclease HII